MKGIITIVSNNPLVSSLLGAAVIGSVTWAVKAYRAHCDKNAIYNFLLQSESQSEYKFRTTAAIASHTGLSEQRTEFICSSHPKIRRNEKQLQSWTLVQ